MKKSIAIFLCMVFVFSSMLGTWPLTKVQASETKEYGTGLTVPTVPETTADQYRTIKAFDKVPYTFEATIKMSKTDVSDSTRGGVILGNFGGENGTINFEINTGGHPRLYYSDTVATDVIFTDVDIRTDEELRLTLTYDNGTFTCYVNGEKKQEKSGTNYVPFVSKKVQAIGTDWRVSTNASNARFKGTIYDVVVWSDTRTADEISNSSIDNLDTTDENLIAAYDFNTLSGQEMNFSDLSGNGYDISRGGIYNLASKAKGLSFTSTTTYATAGALKDDKTVVTMSSWVYLPTATSGRGGVVFGNYKDSTTPCMTLEIHNNGNPRFYHVNGTGSVARDIIFTDTDIRTGEWAHLVYTIDAETSTVSCYLNGVLQTTAKDTNSTTTIIPTSITNGYLLGGDLRSNNDQFYKGRIKEVALYDEILTADEVKTLYTGGVGSLTTEPFSYYDLSNAERYEDIPDAKENNPLIADADFYTDKEAVTDYAYSFAVVGDTQIVSHYDMDNDTNYLSGIYDWILKNKNEKNIQYVFGLGDVTNVNVTTEWANAQREFKKLDGQIPYSVIRGNHDLVGSFNCEDKTADYFTQYVGTEAYKSQFKYGGFYSQENIWNAWRTLTVGETDYLMLSLDYGASDDVLEWASDIIEGHPTHNVIITTHAYLYRDGTTLDANDVCPPATNGGFNNGDHIWDKLVSKHENIVLVMSGHDPSDKIVVSQEEGVNGNKVTSMLIDPQGVDSNEWNAGEIPTAMVAMLYFSEDGKQVQVEYYSTAKERFFMEENQFSTTIDVVEDKIDACENMVVPYSAEEAKAYISGENSYPSKTGFVFAGWYTDSSCDESHMLAGSTPTDQVYALFVPKDVLSIKAQISANLIDSNKENDETGSIRFVTTVNSLQYKEVGFELSYIDSTGVTRKAVSSSDTVYKKLFEMSNTSAWGRTPEGTFCAESKYFKACTIEGLNLSTFGDRKFKVTPYWITAEGDKVHGESTTKSIQQGIDDNISTSPFEFPEYVGVLTGTYNGTDLWKNVWQKFSGYEVGETYIFTCDYYMPQGSKATMRFMGSSNPNSGHNVIYTALDGTSQAIRGTKTLKYTVQEGDEEFFGPCLVQEPGGKGYFWNLRVTKEGSDENLLTNADFAADIDGSWSGWRFGDDLVDSKSKSDALKESCGAEIVKYDVDTVGPWYMAKLYGNYTNEEGNEITWKDVKQTFSDVAEGETYVFTCDYYMPAGSRGGIRFYADGVSGSAKWTAKGSTDSTSVERGTMIVEYTVPADCTWIAPALVQEPGGVAYYWNPCVIKKGGDGTNLLNNAGFTNDDGGSWTGWTLGSEYVDNKTESDEQSNLQGPEVVTFDKTFLD